MPALTLDVDAVTALTTQVTQELILPRFRRLSSSQIELKWTPDNPRDVVTVVDRAVEAHLSNALRTLAPGSVVIGEEAVHDDPELLRLLHEDAPVWLVDPVDGTRNFAAGDDRFGVMISWVLSGQTRAAWIALPARGETYVAEAGAGAYRNGVRIQVEAADPLRMPRGALMSRYMPAEVRTQVISSLEARFEESAPSGCAAIEYTDLIARRGDFVIYFRLHPWDHGAPALMLHEAGGRVVHLDGSAYTVRSGNQITLAAADRALSADLLAWLREGEVSAC